MISSFYYYSAIAAAMAEPSKASSLMLPLFQGTKLYQIFTSLALNLSCSMSNLSFRDVKPVMRGARIGHVLQVQVHPVVILLLLLRL